MSSNGNDGLTNSSNEISLVSKNYLNDDNNFKKELLKVLEEGLKEISGRLYSIEVKIEKRLKNSKIFLKCHAKKFQLVVRNIIFILFFPNMLLLKKVKF